MTPQARGGWLAMLLLSAGAAEPLWGHSEEAAVSLRTYAPVTVDGKLDEWVRRLESSNWTGRLEVQKGDVLKWMRAVPTYVNAITSNVEAGSVQGPADFSAAVYTLWDEERFYIAAVVTDNEVVSQQAGADIWQDDALELWVDCRHDAVTHTLTQADEYQLGFSPASRFRAQPAAWAWRNPQTEPVVAAMQVASALTPTGYLLEGSVPWAVLEGCRPGAGGMIGFNISFADKDDDQLWTHVAWSGKLHSDPSQFGHLYFMDAPIDLFPSDVFEVPDAGGVSLWENGTESPP